MVGKEGCSPPLNRPLLRAAHVQLQLRLGAAAGQFVLSGLSGPSSSDPITCYSPSSLCLVTSPSGPLHWLFPQIATWPTPSPQMPPLSDAVRPPPPPVPGPILSSQTLSPPDTLLSLFTACFPTNRAGSFVPLVLTAFPTTDQLSVILFTNNSLGPSLKRGHC